MQMSLELVRASYLLDAPTAPAATAETPAPMPVSPFVWIPVGSVVIAAGGGEDGNGFSGRVLCDEIAANQIMASFEELTRESFKFWIDTDHDNGAAHAWVTGFSWDAERGILCHVEWTADGVEAIQRKRYRSFSPAFAVDRSTDRPFSLLPGEAAGALVNAPAFGRAMPELVLARSKTLAAKVAASFKPTSTMSAPATEAPVAPTAPAPVKAADASDTNSKLDKVLNALEKVLEYQLGPKSAEAVVQAVTASAAPAAPVTPNPVAPAIVARASTPVSVGSLDLGSIVKAYAAAKTPAERGKIYAEEFAPRWKKDFKGHDVTRILAANSLGALSGDFIAQQSLHLLAVEFPIFNQITTDFSDQPVVYGQTYKTRIRAVPTVRSYDAANGYVDSDATTTNVDVLLDNHKYVQIPFSFSEMASTNRNLFEEQMDGMHYAIGSDIADAIYGLFTVANYPNSPCKTARAGSTVVRADLNAMRAALNKRGVNRAGRTLLINSDATAELTNDSTLVTLAAFRRPEIVDESYIARVAGFDVFEASSLPTSENLLGVGFAKDAVALMVRPVGNYAQEFGAPATGNVSTITNPNTGFSVQLVQFTDHLSGKSRWRVACFYGKAVGNYRSLQRLTSA